MTNEAIRFGMILIYWINGYNGNNGVALFNRNNGAIVDWGALHALIQGAKIAKYIKEL